MTNRDRRSFVKKTGTLAALSPLALLLKSNALLAADNPMVDESSPQAIALKYVAASTTEGQSCSNCSLYQGAADSKAGPCALFPGMSVAGPGWCSAWVAKADRSPIWAGNPQLLSELVVIVTRWSPKE